MPESAKKEHKCSHHTPRESRWHNFHFSGKVIVCSVILGFMLILVGGILMAIGMDRDEDPKSDKYENLQKKPPMVYVGPAIMGIGGFAVIVGILMCLIETKVCRKRNPDSNPLINGEVEQNEVRNDDDAIKDSDPAVIPSTSRHHRDKHRNGVHKKSSPNKSKGSSKKTPSSSGKIKIKSPSSGTSGCNSKSFLTASDTFLTPPNSFPENAASLNCKGNQAMTSLIQSSTSSGKSWNNSTEFQTPSASLIDDPLSLQFMDRKDISSYENHKFLTPQNSDAGILSVPHDSEGKQVQELGGSNHSNEDSDGEEDTSSNNNHTFLTPKNSDAEISSAPVISNGKQVEKLGGSCNSNENTASQQNIKEKNEVLAQVDVTKNSGADSNLPVNIKEDQSHPNSLHLQTNRNESLSADIKSSTASSEGNENHLVDKTAGADKPGNKNIKGNIHDSMEKAEVNHQEINDLNTASDSTCLGDTVVEASTLK